MTALRHRARHVHRTLAREVELGLTAMGWVNTPRNFKTKALTFLEYEPQEAAEEIKPNTVAITLGDESSDEPLELGASSGGLWRIEYPFFIDIYGIDAPIALAIASDAKEVVADLGRYVRDFRTDAAGVETAEIMRIERETVTIERPPVSIGVADFRKHWRVCKGIAAVTFQVDP